LFELLREVQQPPLGFALVGGTGVADDRERGERVGHLGDVAKRHAFGGIDPSYLEEVREDESEGTLGATLAELEKKYSVGRSDDLRSETQ
jgi:hypothetical protein